MVYLYSLYSGRVFDIYPDLMQRIPGYFIGNDLHEAVNRALDFGDVIALEHADKVPVLQQRTHPSSMAFDTFEA